MDQELYLIKSFKKNSFPDWVKSKGLRIKSVFIALCNKESIKRTLDDIEYEVLRKFDLNPAEEKLYK